MSGIEDLKVLLAHMEPTLGADHYVFCTFPDGAYGDYSELSPIASYVEDEGLTLVVTQDAADRDSLDYSCVLRKITLKVHSSLTAVGLTAAVAGQLTRYGISANVIAGYYHDHIFVQAERADEAIQALSMLSAESTGVQS